MQKKTKHLFLAGYGPVLSPLDYSIRVGGTLQFELIVSARSTQLGTGPRPFVIHAKPTPSPIDNDDGG